MFYVGQKVVCVNASGAASKIVKGQVYTIAWIDAPGIGVLLYEVECHPDFESISARRFRRVVERSTDISIFKALLNPKTAETV